MFLWPGHALLKHVDDVAGDHKREQRARNDNKENLAHGVSFRLDVPGRQRRGGHMQEAKLEHTRALMLMGLGALVGAAVGWIASVAAGSFYVGVWVGASAGCIAAIGVVEWTDWLPVRRR